VLESANGGKALRIAEKHDEGNIDLLLIDVVMPYMGGIELAQQLKDIHPRTRVILTSGYTDEAVLQHGRLDPATPFMHKPYLPIDLLQKIQEVLETCPVNAAPVAQKIGGTERIKAPCPR
jgi:two-component system cell cycle sensor histidine kinase/response regulator CckA